MVCDTVHESFSGKDVWERVTAVLWRHLSGATEKEQH